MRSNGTHDTVKTSRLSLLFAVFVVVCGLLYAARPAWATTIYVSQVSLSNGSVGNLFLKVNNTKVKGFTAGQIDLTANVGTTLDSGSTFTLATWSVDSPTPNSNPAATNTNYLFALEPTSEIDSGALSSALITEITEIASYGNNYLAKNGPDADMSAAIQIEIWTVAYGYTYAGANKTIHDDITTVKSNYLTVPVNSGAAALISINPDGSLSQGLIGFTSLQVPESTGPFDFLLAVLAIGAATFCARHLRFQRDREA